MANSNAALPNYIQGYDVTLYQRINIDEKTGRVTATTPWYGKTVSRFLHDKLDWQTHVDKKTIQHLSKVLETEGKQLRETSPPERKYELLKTSCNILTALKTLKFNGIKSDIRDDDLLGKFQAAVEQREKIAEIYKMADNGAAVAYDYMMKQAKERGISSNDPMLLKTKAKLQELANDVRKLHILRLYQNNPDFYQDTLDKSLVDEEALLKTINNQINSLSVEENSPFVQSYLNSIENLVSLGSGKEFRARLETFRDTGEFPTTVLKPKITSKPSERLLYNGKILKELVKEIEIEYKDIFFKGIEESEIDKFIENIALLRFIKLNKLNSIEGNSKDKILGELDAFIEKVCKKYVKFTLEGSDINLKARLEAFRDTGTFA